MSFPIGQMFVIGFDGLTVRPGDPVAVAIQRDRAGGVILFDRDMAGGRRNVESPDQVRALLAGLEGMAATPLLVCVDQEGGLVRRLKEGDGFTPCPAAARLGRDDDPALTRCHAEAMAAELAWLGFNCNLAPVVDLARNPDNPIIARHERTFGLDPALVIRHAAVFIEAHHYHGLACVLKHFPGHGSSNEDSHLGMADVSATWDPIELEPFARLIEQGLADAVMTAHVVHRGLDPELPATLSPRIISELLRGRLGFQGPVFSDDLQMAAIRAQWGFEESVRRAVLADVDVMVVGNNLGRDPDAVRRGIAVIEAMLARGEIDTGRIVRSLARIQQLKNTLQGRKTWKDGNRTA